MKTYSITKLAEIVKQKRVNVARDIERNDLKEINEDRPHKNSPKLYDSKVLDILMKEYLPEEDVQQEHNKSDTSSYNEVEQLLRQQLENERRDKQDLQNQNKELLNLLNQQQQLTLMSNRKVETLELELKEVSDPDEEVDKPEEQKQTKKSLLDKIFNR